MTLKDELIQKRNKALAMDHKEIAEKVWESIYLAFQSFTGLELTVGDIACVEVDQEEDRFWITKFISDGNTRKLKNGEFEFIVGERVLRNGGAYSIMEYVMEMAIKEGVRAWKIEESVHEEESNAWGFKIELIQIGMIDINI